MKNEEVVHIVDLFINMKKEITTIKDRLYKLHEMKRVMKVLAETQIDILKEISTVKKED
jgi:hypothetical protein